MSTRKKVLITVALSLIAVALVLFSIELISGAVERKRVEKSEELLEIELIEKGLISKRVAIEHELRELLDIDSNRFATASFIFREPNAAIYESIRPSMSLFRITGAICLSYKELPGGEGNITEEQLRVLLSEGYTTAVIYDGGEPLSEYLEKTRAALSNLSFEMPDLLYVCGGTEGDNYYLADYTEDGEPIFTEELDAVLEGYGIKTVVQETYAAKTVSYTNFYEPFKYAESLGFLATKRNKGLAADSLNDVLSERGAVVYSVGFDFNDFHSYFGMYDGSLRGDDGTTTDNFVQMLTALTKHTQKLKIIGIGGVRAYREEYNLSIPDLETVAERLAELQAELDSVEAEIAAVKAKYYD